MIKKINANKEVELIDYIRVILKRKLWVFWSFILFILAGLVITLLMPKIYESRAIVSIGNLNSNLIEGPEELIEVLKENPAFEQIAQLMGIENPSEQDAERIKKNLKIKTKTRTNIMLISAQERSPQNAQAIVQATADFIIKRHLTIIQEKNLFLQARIKEIENQIKSAEEQSELLQLKIDQLNQPVTEAQATALVAYLGSRRFVIESINILKSDLSAAKIELIENKNSYLSSSPTVPNKKIKPSLKLNLIVAGLLGIFIGLFWVFLLEWWQNNKEKLKKL